MTSENRYRELTNNNVEHMEKIFWGTIPAGTILYRAAKNICDYSHDLHKKKAKCTNSGRHGIYFGTYLLIALAMALEYDKDLELGVFVTDIDIPAIYGKYNYRLQNPKKYFKYNTIDDRIELKLNVNAKGSEELSHFNNRIFPIINFTAKNGKRISYDMNAFQDTVSDYDGEIFITDDTVLKNIRLVDTYKINVNELKKIVEKHIDDLWPYDYKLYKKAMHKFKCIRSIRKSKNLENSAVLNMSRKYKTRKTYRKQKTKKL